MFMYIPIVFYVIFFVFYVILLSPKSLIQAASIELFMYVGMIKLIQIIKIHQIRYN